jgi:hypothetical protein
VTTSVIAVRRVFHPMVMIVVVVVVLVVGFVMVPGVVVMMFRLDPSDEQHEGDAGH